MNFFSKTIGYFECVLIVLLTSIYYYLTFIVHTDIELHAQFIKDYAYGNKPFQVNFLYYLTVYLFSFFSCKTSSLLVISVYVLSAITFAKYYIVKIIFIKETQNSKSNIAVSTSLLSFLLLFSFSLPSYLVGTNYNYLLRFSPNVWHNSTTIFVMPFVILLFWLSIKQITEYKRKRLYILTILIILNVLVKPSFIFVYVLVYPVFLFNKYYFNKLFWINVIPIIISIILIVIEYLLIFNSSDQSNDESTVVIDFFYYYKVWGGAKNTLDILLMLVSALISSFLFPIVLLLKNRQILKERMVQFSLLAMIVSFLISITLCETGARSFDGNFIWQNYMVSFLLFFVCTLQLLKLTNNTSRNIKAYTVEIIALLFHFFALIYYFSKIITTETYF